MESLLSLWEFPKPMEKARSSNPRSKQNTYLPQSKETFSMTHHIKTVKINGKEKIIRVAREKKKVTYKEKPIQLLSDFSAETL